MCIGIWLRHWSSSVETKRSFRNCIRAMRDIALQSGNTFITRRIARVSNGRVFHEEMPLLQSTDE
jgi:hypothetical protein